MKEGGNITILVLGDEGVGKSSLVSTFVSRHFSELVPGILTRVRLPPDPYLSNCTTTIIDTQNGDEALNSALSLGSAKRDGSLASMNSASADSVSSLSRSHATNLAGSSDFAVNVTGMTASKESAEVAVMPTLKEVEKGGLEQSATSKKSTSRIALSSPFRHIDAVVLIYDLDRMETFHRLESHWLPLIERCYSGELPVIVAGNKMDLLHQTYSVASASDNQFFARSRQQIITLLQRFKFVRQCIKCSAKNLLNVDEVFRKSQQSVLYPINPLFDLNAGKLTTACTRAFTRVFRIFDADGDGLLNDAELNAFQHITWGSTLIERDLSGWKKVVAQHNSYFQREGLNNSDDCISGEEVLQDGKFTVAGFLTIFDVFISQNRLEVPWKVLRTFGYDDELNLNIPSSFAPPGGCSDFEHFSPDKWRLNPSEVHFLSSLFHQFDSDGDGLLSSGDIQSIFSVLRTPLPPWSERGEKLFEGCFSRPHLDRDHLFIPDSIADVAFEPGVEGSPSPPTHPSSPSVSASGITIASSSLPSVDVSKSSETSTSTSSNKTMSYLDWMNHWHMLCTVSPSVCRAELYQLGHVSEIRTLMKRKKFHEKCVPSVFIRALVFGSKDNGRTFIRKLCRGKTGKIVGKEKKELTWSSFSSDAETHCAVSEIVLPWSDDDSETAVHLVLTDIPEAYLVSGDKGTDLRRKLHVLLGKQSGDFESVYDVAVLVFDTADASSFEHVRRVENDFLTEDIPRIFVALKSCGAQLSMSPAIEHCKSMDLESPIILTRDESRLESSELVHFVRCTQKNNGQDDAHFRSTPHGEKKRREAALRQKIIWIGALTAGITVVIGFTMARDAKRSIGSEENGKGRSWLKRTFALVPRMVSNMLKAVRQTSSM